MFPNPSKDYTNLSVYSTNGKNMNIAIHNTIGEVVYTDHISLAQGMNNIQLDSSDLLPGTYYVNVIIDGKNNLQTLTIIK